MAYLANDRQGSKIVVASGEGVAQPPEEQRVVSHDPSVRSPRVRQSFLFVSSHTHTHTHTYTRKGGDVNPARLPKFNAPLVFGRRVSATARASVDAALAPRIRFLLLYFSLGRFYPPRSPCYSMLPSRLVARGSQVQTTKASPVLLHPIGSRFFLIFPLALLCFL